MPSAAYPATIKTDSTVIKGINSIELPYKMDDVDTTTFSQTDLGAKMFTLTLIGAQIKLSGFRDYADAGQAALLAAFTGRTEVEIEYKPLGGTETHTFPALVTGFSVKGDVGGVPMLDVELTMNGNTTIVTS